MSPPSTQSRGHAPLPWIAGALVLCAALIRVRAALNPLWLDEIWAINIVAKADSLWQAVATKRDNNHLIQTCLIYLLGPDRPFLFYRLLALLCGAGSTAAAFLVGLRSSRTEAIVFSALIAFSYLMVLYDSEGRGYSQAVFGSLISFAALRSYCERPRFSLALIYCAAACFGFLGHFSYAIYYLAGLAYSLLALRSRANVRPWRELFVLQLPPAVLFLTVYFLHIRLLPPGTGPVYSPQQLLIEVVSLAAGGPELSDSNMNVNRIAQLLSFCLLCWTAAAVYRTRDLPLKIFYLFLFFGGPLIALLVLRPQVLFVRYFLVCITFWYLLLAQQLAAWFQAGGARRLVALLVLSLCLLAQAGYIEELWSFGRGDYPAALAFVRENSLERPVRVSSDYDFQARTIIDFYQTFSKEGPIEYVETSAAGALSPEWYFTHTLDRYTIPPASLEIGAARYSLIRDFPSAPQSGWNWFLYHRENELRRNL